MMTFKEQYFKIIQHRQANPLEDGVYGEKHHIVPRSLGGSDDEENLVKLTAQEHYDCHEILPFMYLEEGNQNGYDKMMYAWNCIRNSHDGLVINAEQYAEMRERFATMHSKALKGKKRSDATKQKMSQAHKGKKQSDDTKKKIGEATSKALKGRKLSDDAKQKLSEAHRKPFEIDNIHFESQRDAAKHFGVSQRTIWQWLHNPEKYHDHQCKYIFLKG